MDSAPWCVRIDRSTTARAIERSPSPAPPATAGPTAWDCCPALPQPARTAHASTAVLIHITSTLRPCPPIITVAYSRQDGQETGTLSVRFCSVTTARPIRTRDAKPSCSALHPCVPCARRDGASSAHAALVFSTGAPLRAPFNQVCAKFSNSSRGLVPIGRIGRGSRGAAGTIGADCGTATATSGDRHHDGQRDRDPAKMRHGTPFKQHHVGCRGWRLRHG